jgi:hypothetical protein
MALSAFLSVFVAPNPLNPLLNISSPKIAVEPVHTTKLRAAKAESARAAVQTVPRQKRSLERKTERAMKPAK